MFNSDELLKSSPRKFWQSFILISVVISAIAIYQTERQVQALSGGIRFHAVISIFMLNLGPGIFLLLRRDKNDVLWQKLEFSAHGIMPKIFGMILIVFSFPVLWYIKFYIFNEIAPSFFIVLWGWLWITLMQAIGLKMLAHTSWVLSIGLSLLLGGITFQFYSVFRPVSDYPFSLGWSEAARFYYGSLPFSKSIYGAQLPLSFLNGTQYFLLSLAFLFGKLSIWEARLWQAFLWLATNGLTALLLIRRLKLNSLLNKLLVWGWFFLFLFQGPIYYQLLICVIIILAGVSPRHFIRSLVAVAVASIWAGMSRVNWFPVPAMLAITICLLEEPFSKYNNIWKYIQKPILWGVAGMVSAIAGQFFYIFISGNSDLSEFGSSFTSALLWYRLWPSSTNPLGIIPGLIIISMPPFVMLAWILRGSWNSFHPLRWLGISAMLFILLIGGLIVSVKIGGGSNLHNMDAYIVMLGLVTMYFMNERVEPESNSLPALKMDMPFAMSFLLIIPVAFSLSNVILPVRYDQQQAAEDLQTLRTAIQAYSQKGEVLFINERHLLTFGLTPEIPVIPEYEAVWLTEMAISGNQPSLDNFYQDLKKHRFVAIVAGKQNLKFSTNIFGEENNIWINLVAYPLLCEYQPILILPSTNLQVFVPREKPCLQP